MFAANEKNRAELSGGNISSSSLITFHLNELGSISKIIDLVEGTMKSLTLFLDQTPFHPVDLHWPDQPADRGTITIKDKIFNVADCKILGIHKESKEIRETTEILKSDKNNWHFVVGHIVENQYDYPLDFFLDSEAVTQVDADYRAKISLHHTSCHLAAFALNFALKDFWGKEVDLSNKDSLGSPNFDQLAMEKSLIFTNRSEDIYRFGKSLKKKGFQVQKLIDKVDNIQLNVNGLLHNWLRHKSHITIAANGLHLDDRRLWQCDLDVGLAELPCGGTHVPSLLFIKAIKYSLKLFKDEATAEYKLLAITEAQNSEDVTDNSANNKLIM